MLRVLIIFLVLAAGMIIGPILAGHQGVVLFQAYSYRIKMSLTVFTLIHIFIILLLYLIYWGLQKIFNSKTKFGSWLRSKSPRKSAKKMEQAQLSLLEGDYKKAGKLLSKSAKAAKNNALTYLQAAQAEINNSQFTVAIEHLEQAAIFCKEKEKFAFRLVQLRLQLKSRQYDLAKINVEKLLDEKPRHPEVLRLADQFYYEIGNYQSIIELLPAMYKTEVFDESRLDEFKNTAYIARIKQIAEKEGVNRLDAWWKEQPKVVRNNPIYQERIAFYQK